MESNNLSALSSRCASRHSISEGVFMEHTAQLPFSGQKLRGEVHVFSATPRLDLSLSNLYGGVRLANWVIQENPLRNSIMLAFLLMPILFFSREQTFLNICGVWLCELHPQRSVKDKWQMTD